MVKTSVLGTMGHAMCFDQWCNQSIPLEFSYLLLI